MLSIEGMKKLSQPSAKDMNLIRNAKGRFFGLYTRQGGVYNAQFVAETPKYITIYDRNSAKYKKLAKASISSVNITNKR